MKMTLYMQILPLFLGFLFYSSMKKKKKEMKGTTAFECGFTSYFYSRFSFSIHYYMVALIFLFLDLELYVMVPMMSEMESSLKMKILLMFFVLTLLAGLLLEWWKEKLEWKS